MIYAISCKTFMASKPLRILFKKIDGFIKIYNEIRDLILFGPESYDEIFNRIRYLISETSGTKDIINHDFARIRIGSNKLFTYRKNTDFS